MLFAAMMPFITTCCRYVFALWRVAQQNMAPSNGRVGGMQRSRAIISSPLRRLFPHSSIVAATLLHATRH